MFDKTTLSWDTLKAYVQTKPDKIYTGISPSSLGGCMRSHFWKVNGVKATTPPNPGALVNFEVGHHWEQVLAKAFDSQGKLVKWFQDGVDDPWYDESTMIAGTPDLIVRDNDEDIIVDSKTVASAWFKYAETKGFKAWVADNKDYVFQQLAYIHLARVNGYPKLNKAVLSFASKDNGFIGMEFQITATPPLMQKMIDRALTLKRYLNTPELPPCTCEGWKVGYCNYGNPATLTTNSKGKEVNSECCQPAFVTEGK